MEPMQTINMNGTNCTTTSSSWGRAAWGGPWPGFWADPGSAVRGHRAGSAPFRILPRRGGQDDLRRRHPSAGAGGRRLRDARLLLVTTPDSVTTLAVVADGPATSGPDLHVVARAETDEMRPELRDLGVHEVVQPSWRPGWK